jgi:hypothetical protein
MPAQERTCLAASPGGVFFASPVAADGKVYMVSETGETYVLRAGRQAEVLARTTRASASWASPAISRRDGSSCARQTARCFPIGR